MVPKTVRSAAKPTVVRFTCVSGNTASGKPGLRVENGPEHPKTTSSGLLEFLGIKNDGRV